jgi:tetratricopeptide (TPR) repeat protein
MGGQNSTPVNIQHIGGHSRRRRVVTTYLLVWLDNNLTVSTGDYQHSLTQLQTVIEEVNLFTETEKCANFLQGVQAEKIFLIASGALGRELVPRIHPLTQIDTICIYCSDKRLNEEWVKKWPKVKGVYTQIKPICEILQLAVKQCDQDSTAVSFAQVSDESASDINPNQLEPSFMYTQLFKKTLLNMQHDREKAVIDFVRFCQEEYAEKPSQLKLVNEFGRDYRPHKAIWWYTRECFIHQMLNRALRLLEADIIVNMGFFIHDLHQQIQQLHQEQLKKDSGDFFYVYRGQGLSTGDFEKLKKTQGGLLSFNCFLSTSREKEISLKFVENAITDKDKVGILFVMRINRNVASAPFADVKSSSYFKIEAEILFSMHTVFRIGTIKSRDDGRRYFEVNLAMTKDDDKQLSTLMKRLDADVQAPSGWERMGQLLIQVGQPDKAEELYNTLLERSSDEKDQGRYCHQLGYIKDLQGDYKEALSFYERALEIRQKRVPADHPSLGSSYNNIGLVYESMGQYPKALTFHERALQIRQRSLPTDHPSLATSYHNIGSVYQKMSEYPKALSFYEKALEIGQKRLPANHPSFVSSYNNIGLLYQNMGEYSKALSFHGRALEIGEKSLPLDHPDLKSVRENMKRLKIKLNK